MVVDSNSKAVSIKVVLHVPKNFTKHHPVDYENSKFVTHVNVPISSITPKD